MRAHQILLVDDHALVREGLIRIIRDEPDLAVCCEATNVADALREIDQCRPDLILLDLSLEGPGGFGLLEELRQRGLNIPVLVLSMHDETIHGERALRAGARGYIMKQEPSAKVVEGIRAVLRGDFFFSPGFNRRLLAHLAQGERKAAAATADFGIGALSNREVQVLELIGRGHSTRAIAAQLNLSPKTVEAHRVRIRNRLNLPDSTALVHFAIRWAGVENAAGKPR